MAHPHRYGIVYRESVLGPLLFTVVVMDVVVV